ncbi:centromere protein O isoform X2 [Hypanus sabinus]|uniref:centromere protein O isoform X2 n=1 Tax=Hypanus sabinus TaxID=79690 RepID=UPI0028C4D341|nr:centromere protein O isoform X2 [Hypanus sabinus]
MAGSSGVLEQLRQLEQRAERQGVEQEEAMRSQGRLAQLRATVLKLRAQRDLLRSRVTAKSAGDIQEVLAQSQQQSAPQFCKEELDRTVLQEKLKSVQALILAYRLTGISAELMGSSTFTFSISTAYENTYLESYYLDIQVQHPRRVIRHNVPAFIPVEQMAQAFLQKDLAYFLGALHKALNAYVGRRYQLEQLQELHASYVRNHIQRNAACNLLKFHYPIWCGENEQTVLVKLIYEDLTSCLPTDVTITCTGVAAESLQEKLEGHRQMFLHQHLHHALESIKPQEATVLSSGSLQQHDTQTIASTIGD